MKNSYHLSLQSLFDQFIADLEFEGAKPATIDKHQRNFKKVNQFGFLSLEDLNKGMVKQFLMERRKMGNRTYTIQNYLKTFRRFGQWLEREHFVSISPVKDVPYPRRERTPPIIPSLEEYQEIQITAKNLSKNEWINRRFSFLIEFLALTGARITSARKVKLSDIDGDRGIIKLDDPKNNTYYYFPIDSRLNDLLGSLFVFRREYVREHLKINGYQEAPRDFLFFGKHPKGSLGEKTIRTQFKALCTKLKKRIHPHMFRKYFAQQCYLNGLNQYEIQGLLNHSDIRMIQVYTKQDQGHLKASLDRAFDGRNSNNRTGYHS